MTSYKNYRYIILITTLAVLVLIVHWTTKESTWENVDNGVKKVSSMHIEKPISVDYEDDAYGLAMQINRVFKTYQKRTRNSELSLDSMKLQLMTISGISDTCASLISSSAETDLDSLRNEILKCVYRNPK